VSPDSPDRWRRISSLFDEAVKLPPEERAAFLEAACGDDPDLKAQVARLLESADLAEGFLEKPLVSQAGPLLREAMEDFEPGSATPPPEDPTGTSTLTTPAPSGSPVERIGPYRLLQKIGEGGMGEVWLAEQTEPVRRRVALKLIKAGMDTKQVIARFEAERQALALMEHPAIAKVYEAGETPRGLPYFAMEYVAGEPITAYCDRHRLGMAERLDLFARVCDGVQHAHQKGVIHRDLKPSNVLVAIQDGKPVPKIIDFGVAKATAQRLTEKTMFTELGVLIGTPEYMSPEQAEMTGLDVDTRTDVYALGVMLYELLTGALPFESKELRQAGYDEIRRRIREVDPPRPSTRVSTLGEKATHAAKNRRTEPRQLAGRLRGDLDWIVMKALEKDRTRRYGSPAELAADLGRHLDHEPVVAGPPSASYRARKFVRRHRVGVALATLALVGLVAFGVAMAIQARTIARERDRAERVSEFLVGLFNVSDPSEARGNAITAREVLDKGVEKIQRELTNEPEVQARLKLTMGTVFKNLGLAPKAEPLVRQAVEARRRVLGPEHPDTLRAQREMARVKDSLGRYKEAENLLLETVATQRRVLGDDHPDTLDSEEYLAVIYERQGRFDESKKLAREVLEARRRVLGDDDPRTLWSMSNVGFAFMLTGQMPEAEKLYREAIERRRRVSGEDHPDTLWVMNNYGILLEAQGRLKEAEQLFLQVIEARRRVLGADHPDTIKSMSDLADVYTDQHRNPEAEKLYREALATQRRVVGTDSVRSTGMMNNLAVFYTGLKRYEEAERLLREQYEIEHRLFGDGSPNLQAVSYNLACVTARRGRRNEALDWLRKSIVCGFKNADGIAQDSDLQSLRGDPEFERLVVAARDNAKPKKLENQ
jgi:eukaryotic-like serine/threonine-protein kinase